MCMKDVEVKNQVGLHARPATFFIQKANEYKSSIWVEKEERRVNAKSLLGILSLGIVGGANIRIIADGSDEQLAVDGLVKLVEGGFSESLRETLTKPNSPRSNERTHAAEFGTLRYDQCVRGKRLSVYPKARIYAAFSRLAKRAAG